MLSPLSSTRHCGNCPGIDLHLSVFDFGPATEMSERDFVAGDFEGLRLFNLLSGWDCVFRRAESPKLVLKSGADLLDKLKTLENKLHMVSFIDQQKTM